LGQAEVAKSYARAETCQLRFMQSLVGPGSGGFTPLTGKPNMDVVTISNPRPGSFV